MLKVHNRNKSWKAKIMAEELDQSEVVSVEEAIKMEMLINQDLRDLLVAKGILT